MLARRHIAIGGNPSPRYVVANESFIDLGEDGSLSFSASFSLGAGFDNETITFGIDDFVAQYRAVSVSNKTAQVHSFLRNNYQLLASDTLESVPTVPIVFNVLYRIYRRFAGSNVILGVSGYYLFEFSASTSIGITPSTTNAFRGSDLAISYGFGTYPMYLLDYDNDRVRCYNDAAYDAAEVTNFSVATQLTQQPMRCVYNPDDDVLYVLDRGGKIAAYDVSPGNVGTSLGTVSLDFTAIGLAALASQVNMKYDTNTGTLYVTEGDDGNGIHVINVTNHASMSATRIAGGTSLVGGTMCVYPATVAFKYGQMFIFSGKTDSENDVQLICVDNSSALSTSSDVLGSVVGTDLGNNSGVTGIGYGAVY